MPHRVYAFAIVLVLVVAAVVGCSPADPPVSKQESSSVSDPLTNPAPAKADMEKQPLNAEQRAWLNANINAFSHSSSALVLSAAEGNAIYSPCSTYLALSVLYECADNATKEELRALLQMDADGDQAAMSTALLGNLIFSNSNGRVTTVNSLFAEEGVLLPGDLACLLQTSYDVELHLGLNSDSGEFPSLDPSLSDSTAVLILNEIDFQNRWASPFSTRRTKPDIFFLTGGREVTCDFMEQSIDGYISYVQTDRYTATDLSFKDGFTLYFILPHEGVTPAQLLEEADLFSTALDTSVENPAAVRGEGEILFRTPKLDFEGEIGLKDVLQTLGINAVFRPLSDGFLFVTEDSAPLYVSSVRQQSSFQMDEDGAKAKALTIIEMEPGAAPPPEPEEPLYLEFILDRPFLFAIESQEGYLLFTGIVNDPTLSEF